MTTKQIPKEKKVIIYKGDDTWFKEMCFFLMQNTSFLFRANYKNS